MSALPLGIDFGGTGIKGAPVDLATAVADLERDGTPRKDAMALVARSAGVSRRVVY